MDALSFLGLIAMIAAAGAIVYVVRNQSNPQAPVGREKPARMMPQGVKEQLNEAPSGSTVTLIGERERAIQASVTLHEMFQATKSSPWSRTGNVSRALVLAGDVWIFKVPSREAGKPVWLRAIELPSFSLTRFYRGSESEPGPAKLFNNNEQSDPVPYELPKDLTPGISWEIIDIGAFKAEVDGSCDNVSGGDMLYFVTSREQGGERRLIYLDARKGEANGSGGLFLAEPFEPSVDVSNLM